MVPAAMDELLFDDVLFGDAARDEHALFRRVLQFFQVEVVESLDLLSDVLAIDEARRWIHQQVAGEISEEVLARMAEATPQDLAEELIWGVRVDPFRRGAVETRELFRVPPLPNWCFQRDPQVVLGNGVIHCGP